MPDPAKLTAMTAVGVRVAQTCATCAHGDFVGTASWGDCARSTYVHGRHERRHNLPAHVALVCDRWEERPVLASVRGLGEYANLLPTPVR